MKVGTRFSEEFEAYVGVHQGQVSSPLLFAIVVDVATNEIKEGMLQEFFYTDDIVLRAESMTELQEKFNGWKSAHEIKGVKVNQMRSNQTKVIVSKIGQITEKPSSKKDPCGICGRKTMLIAVLCKSCGNLIHEGCAKIKTVTNRLAIDLICRKCKGYHKIVDQKEKSHDYAETVTEFSYLGDRIKSRGGCVAAMISRTY